uniref:Uncharacterized protein n=1 Tax=Chromera velia CCMP2878 TaxID=1169474 RepID=A0A0G4HIZ0_9ALVE|eukprot:Cvel_27973.t1-p1 / transcript=Cvel_27973.t1 / gene=Cvel_27973 / organism=Chromera_velia_CCMP2878 / gene_product=hypothetical protein / transcript_product=hypothetical protein / location=Cvel_scaffold3575:13072-14123(+) / protein_length=158 / sequence_SO=supercontig / SO=protein_coding / is_pseudo=false
METETEGGCALGDFLTPLFRIEEEEEEAEVGGDDAPSQAPHRFHAPPSLLASHGCSGHSPQVEREAALELIMEEDAEMARERERERLLELRREPPLKKNKRGFFFARMAAPEGQTLRRAAQSDPMGAEDTAFALSACNERQNRQGRLSLWLERREDLV